MATPPPFRGRVFDGKKYLLSTRHRTKREAVRRAKNARKRAFNVRVVKSGKTWLLYVRTRRPRGEPGEQRKFGGKTFKAFTIGTRRGAAVNIAKEVRRRGGKARVLKSGGQWFVFVRGKF